MTVTEVMSELKSMGNASIKKLFLTSHGAREPLLGVKIEDLKKIVKRVKVDHKLALSLYDTGVSDAMYLAGLIADDRQMTKKDLQRWAEQAPWHMISGFTVPWVAAGSNHGHEMALKWIDSKEENVAIAGWCTLAGEVAIKDDSELNLKELEKLMARVEKSIHDHKDRLGYSMNSFVIAVGGYVAPLTKKALETAKRIGKIECDMGDNSCKIPDAVEYINKMLKRGVKKRKMLKC